jgi:hypothetical protein
MIRRIFTIASALSLALCIVMEVNTIAFGLT